MYRTLDIDAGTWKWSSRIGDLAIAGFLKEEGAGCCRKLRKGVWTGDAGAMGQKLAGRMRPQVRWGRQ